MKQRNCAKEIVDTFNVIYKKNLTTVSGGNLSIKQDNGSIWISPTSIDKGELTEEDMVCALPDGTFIGKNTPSIEFPFHQKIYEVSPKIKAIIHVHAPNLIAASILRKVPPINILPHCSKIIGHVGIAPYDVPGGYELGEKIAAVFAEGNDCVIMENHGIVLGADTMQHAFDRLEAINLIFEIYTRSKILGDLKMPETDQSNLWENIIDKTYNEENEYIKEASELHKFVKRIYEKNLSMTNPEMFCISQRVDGGMITNLFKVSLYNLNETDYVFINEENSFSYHQKVHLEIYKKNPNIQCITTAIAPNIMSFAVTGTKFTTEIIPEAYVVLRNVSTLEYEEYGNINKILDTINNTTNEVVFKNNCFICCGSTPLKMYDRVEVLEFSAKAVIDAKNVGDIVYIKGDAIKDIIKAFNLEE
ncbi:MAG: class II aldolase/adducin family protein [Eubacteriales bacterium]